MHIFLTTLIHCWSLVTICSFALHYFQPSSYALVPLQHHFSAFSLCSSGRHLNTTASSWVTSYQDALVLIALLLRFNKKLFYPFMFKNLFLRSSLCLCVVARSVIKIFISLVAAHFISCWLTLDCVKTGSHDWRGSIGVPQRTVWFVLTTLRQTALWDRQFRDFLFVVDWSQVLCLLYFQWSRWWTTVASTVERYLLIWASWTRYVSWRVWTKCGRCSASASGLVQVSLLVCQSTLLVNQNGVYR